MTLCRILEIGIGLQKVSARNRKLAEVGFIDRDQEHHIIQADEVLIETNMNHEGWWLKNMCSSCKKSSVLFRVTFLECHSGECFN